MLENLGGLWFWIAQFFGLIALITLIISLQQKNRKNLLKFQIISMLGYTLQYVFLGAWTGSLVFLLATIRNVIYYQYGRKKIPRIIPIIFAVIVAGCGIITYAGPISIFPTLGSVMFTLAVAQKNMTITRTVEIFTALLTIIYSVHVQAYTGIMTSGVEFLSAFIAVCRFDIPKIHKKNRRQRVKN